MPARDAIAFAEAGGALRLSPKGLAEDAPRTFASAKAAGRYSEKNDLVKSLFDPLTPNTITISGEGVKSRVFVSFRIKGIRGSAKTRAILQCAPEDAARLAYEKWGELVAFEIEQTSQPISADSQDALDEWEERAARFEYGVRSGRVLNDTLTPNLSAQAIEIQCFRNFEAAHCISNERLRNSLKVGGRMPLS
jgi:hypothetical protein